MYKYNSIISDSKWYDIYEYDLDQLFKGLNSKSNSNDEFSEEEQRILIFRDALQQRKGELWVSKELKAKRLRAIYTRNPIELVILYCLQSNDTNGAFKTYDLNGFIKLVKSLPKIAPPEEDLTTFGHLHDYVERHNAFRDFIDDDERRSLPAITQKIKKEIDGLDKTSPSAEGRFIDIYHQHLMYLVNTSSSIQYYVSKYIYYILCAQILEFKEILSMFSENTPEKALHLILEDKEHYSQWTLAGKIAFDEKVESSVENDDNSLQISKILLSSLTKYFPLYGKLQSRADSVSPLFVHMSDSNKDAGTKRVISFAQLKDETFIFESSSNFANKKLHIEKEKAINALTISDFYGFRIDYNQLYGILFETISGAKNYVLEDESIEVAEKEKSEQKIQSKFLRSIVGGTMDVSRSALLMLLASAKSVIDSTDLLLTGDYSILRKDILDLDRVNYILNRVGYVDLSDDDDELSFDSIYEIFFDTYVEEEKNISYINDLTIAVSDFIETHGQSAMPFEMTEISSEVAHKRMMKG